MAVFQPTYRDSKTGKQKTSKVWWYEFIYSGKRIRESAKTTRKTVALEAEKDRRRQLERRRAGLPAEDIGNRIEGLQNLLRTYRKGYAVNHREKSVAWVEERSAHLEKHLGGYLVPDVTEDVARGYMRARATEGAGNRTVNMELEILSRAMGHTWKALWPKVKKPEEPRDAGRALSQEEQDKLLAGAAKSKSRMIHPFMRIALTTGMRFGEIRTLRWGNVDMKDRTIVIGKAKTDAGRRIIPMNQDLFATIEMHLEWFKTKFEEARPEWYLFPFSSRVKPIDPERPATTVKTAWEAVREDAGVTCRFHDLRHTALTKMAEAGVPESTMLDIAGHMSRAMLQRYSHIRMKAKREAVEALSLAPRQHQASDGVPQVSPKVTPKSSLN